KYDVHEYEIMEEFSRSLKDKESSDALWHALKGKGAFRRFKDTVNRFGIADEWYRYRDEALKQIAITWCESQNIEYIDQ
ncbi:MAG TPA: UPF0158 family protein, partial [Dissulfurispiraceae bacterium]|nr:UPF0158 family protein [Dissulfurispiraceae bacterium]